MILPRDLYSSPPPAKTKQEDNATLLVSWWCTGFALAIILVRILGRYVRTEKLFREDKIMFWSIIPLMARMGLVHLILLWGTNNAITDGLSPDEIRHREIGSRLVLASRIMYAMFLWMAKFTVSEFLKRLTSQVWKRSYEIGLQGIRWFLIVTFLLVVIATLSECQPFSHYWQVVPDPGAHCRQGIAQLVTMGTSDVITDLLLVCFPIPIVLKSHMPAKRKLSLVLLFGLSLILVAITVYRVIGVTDRHSDQQFRSLLASLEILAAAAVSNALVLGSFVRDRGAKKQRFRFGSTGGNSSLDRGTTPRRTITARNWGSDADLVGDLGMRCTPDPSDESALPRPAPIALPLSSQAKNLTPAPVSEWNFPTRSSAETAETDPNSPSPLTGPDPSPHHIPQPPRSPSFFDVGGLLGEAKRPTRPPPQQQSKSTPPPYPRPSTQQPTLLPSAPRSPSQNPIHSQPPQNPPHNRLMTPPPNFSRPTSAQRVASTSPPSTAPASEPRSRKGSQALLQDIGGLLSAVERPPAQGRGVSLVEALREGGETVEGGGRKRIGGVEGGGGGMGLRDVGGLLG